MSIDQGEFPTELRGYRRADVEAALSELRTELMQAAKDRAQALEDLTAARTELEQFRNNQNESHTPSYTGLGGRLEAVLRIAEEQSTRIISQADIDADRVTEDARAQAEATLEAASKEARRIVSEAEATAKASRESAEEHAEKLLAEANAEAERVRTEAIEEAASIRGAVSTETAKLRASAKRESESLRAEAERAIAEQRSVAEREIGKARSDAAALQKEIEVERATHELTLKKIQEEAALAKTQMEQEVAATHAKLQHDNEKQAEALALVASQARSDLDLELKARRAESERELLDAHQKAVELNNRFLAEATTQREELTSQLASLREEHQKVADSIAQLNETGRDKARAEAREMVAKAEAEAKEIIDAATGEASKKIAESEKRVAALRVEKDTIASYIESLRSVVQVVDTAAQNAQDAQSESESTDK